MTILKWNEDWFISQSKLGLRSEVKDLLVGREMPNPLTFDKFVQLCIKLDNAWRARETEKKAERDLSIVHKC
jgi:hypothetical protein